MGWLSEQANDLLLTNSRGIQPSSTKQNPLKSKKKKRRQNVIKNQEKDKHLIFEDRIGYFKGVQRGWINC